MDEIKEFPKTLPWEQLGQTNGVYDLKESEGLFYAFYEKDIGFGFNHETKTKPKLGAVLK